ncbi:MAG TPA: hypothetical protein VKA67_02935 [Verrucomicrobiae bacterium]|nr:hypothetical protein [Verrucomicrobiae bacterium]
MNEFQDEEVTMIQLRSLMPAILLAAPVTALAAVPAGEVPPPSQSMPSMSLTRHKTSWHHKSKKVPKFKKADKNDDGKIEWREAKATGVPKKLFKREDFNKTGSLTKPEWAFVRMDMKQTPPG